MSGAKTARPGVLTRRGTNGEFALLTSLLYAWNPGDYDPDRAAAAAEQVTAGLPPTGGAS